MDLSYVRDPTPAQQRELAASLEGELINGKYRVERLIGVGGMGIVVSALHLDLERYVAIKLIRDELTRDQSTLQRFLLEARSAAKMTNQHVCRVLDVGRLENGTPFIVMELLQGCDLGAILKERGRVEPAESVDWVLQACEGVAEAHSLRIVHRDLKPDNLFMTRLGDGSPCVKVLDFGISKVGGTGVASRLTAPRTIIGSPRYMAPEQMLFSAADERADIWALGAILYELTSGTPAFAGESVATICSRVINEPPAPPRARAPEVPPALERVIMRCLEREPGARYQNIAALAAELAPLGSSSSTASFRRISAALGTPGAPLEPRPRPTQRLEPSDPTGSVLPPERRTPARTRLWWALAGVTLAGSLVTLIQSQQSAPDRSAPVGTRAAADAPLQALSALAPAVAASAAPASSPGAPSAGASAAAIAKPAAAQAALAQSAVPQSSVAQPTATRATATQATAPRVVALPSGVTGPSIPARRAPAPLEAGATPPDHRSVRRDPRHPSAVQEAWDTSKFGGRE